jgi:hypothetical protein
MGSSFDAVGRNAAGTKSCSVLSVSVVARGRVSVLKSFNSVTRGGNRKRDFAETGKLINRICGVRCFTQKPKSAKAVGFAESWKVIKYADITFHAME